jgi:outer membrane protein
MTQLKMIALALALAPATAFATDGPGFAFTGGYGAFDGGGNPLSHMPVPMPGPLATLDNDNSDNVWSVSASWFINQNFAIELWTAQGAEQSVQIDTEFGPDIDVASYSTAPITLMAQYHFGDMGRVTPFAGIGWHWTNISGVTTNLAYDDVAGLKLSNDSGLAAVVGLDVALAKGWFARGDVRWMDSSTDVSSLEHLKKTVNTDKLYYGVALGYRF